MTLEDKQLTPVERTKRYITRLLPLNSLINGKVTILNRTVEVDLRVIDFVGQKDNKLLYKVVDATYGTSSGYLLYKISKAQFNSKYFAVDYYFSYVPTYNLDSVSPFDVINTYLPNKAINILVLGGPSGAGKTYLEKYLIEHQKNSFNKLHQVTTRNSRGDEDPYLFVSSFMYEQIKDMLIGKIDDENKYNNYYGSLPLFDPEKINTIILSEEGYNNLKQYWQNNPNIVVFSVYIGTDDLSTLEARTNRDKDVVEDELRLKNMFMLDIYRDIEKTEHALPEIAKLLALAFDRSLRLS